MRLVLLVAFLNDCRIGLIKYFQSELHNHRAFYKKRIPVLRMKMHGLMILMVRYSFLMMRLTHAVF